MGSLIEQLVDKMGLHDESNVLEKSTELVRRLELRSVNMPLQVNEYAKIVLCIDIAAEQLAIPFDKEQAFKLAAVKKSQYVSSKRMFEKLLDLNKIVGVQDICIQLGLNEYAAKAKELLDLYKKVAEVENAGDIDITHPQYAAMSVFQACKLGKKKPPKSKLMPFSNLKPTQWQHLEQRWEKFIEKHYKSAMDNKLVKPNEIVEAKKDASQPSKVNVKASVPQVEDYEKWKERMLQFAQSQLKDQQEAPPLDNSMQDKENLILGI